MKILVTGARGFIGKNLIAELRNQNYTDIYEFDIDTEYSFLEEYCMDCEFVFNLAGVNRPKSESEFMEGNRDFISYLIECLKKSNNKSPILNASSIQAEYDNPYGRSKKAGEDLLIRYAEEYGVRIYNYRLPNVFGKWCKPGYNSVVATFCHNVAHGIDIVIDDPNDIISLAYIDDVFNLFIEDIKKSKEDNYGHYKIDKTYTKSIGGIAKLIYSFKEGRNTKEIIDLTDEFTKRLYATYLSYLPHDGFIYPLRMNVDERGSFTEFIKSPYGGQVSVNIIKPGAVKGNHWHHTKNEKFLVVEGNGVVRLRQINDERIIEYRVGKDKLEVVDVPVGYVHNITNVGDGDLVIIIWCSECYDPKVNDTYYETIGI